MTKKKHLAILGSTGSIGCQALEVVAALPDSFSVDVLTTNGRVDELVQQAKSFRPKVVVIGNDRDLPRIKKELTPLGIDVQCGPDALANAGTLDGTDIVLTALVGYSGLLPTIRAIEAGKHIALANKETLVVAGELISRLARKHNVSIVPVDSEHSAIFQCLVGESSPIEKIILTASGGPFRGKSIQELKHVTQEQALNHPNWNMGAKITIDSATLMNKGLEAIEARWLFDVRPDQIEVVIHAQSIIHSIVQFEDGSMKAQMGLPDMRLPIQYALTYPERKKTSFPRFDFRKYPMLTFDEPDTKTFRNLVLAFEAMEREGNMPCVLNAANEVAVAEFLSGKIGFLEIPDVVEHCLQNVSYQREPNYLDYVQTDSESRMKAHEFIGSSFAVDGKIK